jgi:hypothetical protein
MSCHARRPSQDRRRLSGVWQRRVTCHNLAIHDLAYIYLSIFQATRLHEDDAGVYMLVIHLDPW